MNRKTTDLLIIGAGPVGLTLACESIRHGLNPRIIDVLATPSVHSKAQIVHARTMELLEDMGIEGRFLERGTELHSFNVFTDRGAKRLVHLTISGLDSRYQGILSISQHDTEQLLADRLEELGVSVERGVRLETFSQRAESVTASLRNEANGKLETVEVPWIVGCDGAHSTVRHTLDLPFDGHPYPVKIMQSDVRVDMPFEQHDDEILVFIAPSAVAAFFPLPGGENRYRFLVPISKAEQGDQITLDDFQQVLDTIAPPGSRASDPKWIVSFAIHCRQAPKFRVGRAFLAGDAGHIHSPAGGQGMNMGMQDAYNLAWKLGLVGRGLGTDALLDSYSTERHRVAADTLAWTDFGTRGGLRNLGIKNDIAIAARNRLMGFVGSLGLVQQRVSRVMSMLDVAYPSSDFCAQDRVSVLDANVTLDTDSEEPTVRSWVSFGGGPAPGHRAPDINLDPHDEESLRCHQLLRGTAHSLLLFDGAAATPEGYRNLVSVADTVGLRFGQRVKTHIVIPYAAPPPELDYSGSVIFDAAGVWHQAFGAQTECLYLIRPDGYVGYRCQPAEGQLLFAHLEKSLV